MVVEKQFVFAPERVVDDLWCLPVPLQDGSPVNVYVFVCPDGIRLVDGGLGTPASQASLREQLAELGYSLADVRTLLITHAHSDHVGAAAEVARAGGEVLIHPLDARQDGHLEFDDAWLAQHGLAPAVRALHWSAAEPPEPTTEMADGDVLQWGDFELRLLWCPGHTPGLLCVYEPRRRLLFTTDHVMRRATSPVLLRRPGGNPLGDYLASVRRLEPLMVDTVLPGHGRPFGHLKHRLNEIEHQEEARLNLLRTTLKRQPATAAELARVLAGNGATPPTRDTAFRSRAMLAQALARLRYLESLGEVVATSDGELIQFSAV